MKIAFDEEATSSQVDVLRKSLMQLRHPASVMQTFAFTHSHVLLQPQLHAKNKEKTASLKYVTNCPVCLYMSIIVVCCCFVESIFITTYSGLGTES